MGKKGKGDGGDTPKSTGTEAELQKELEAKVSGDLDAEPKVFEDEYKGELDDLKQQAADLGQGPLPTLDEETAGEFDEMLAAQKGELDMRRKQEQEQLLLRMFGSGGQQSSVAGEAAGRMLFGQEQTHRALLADDAQRRLGARAEMADRMMNSIAFQAQVAQSQQATALQAFGIEVSQEESAKDRAANMLDALYGRRSAEKQTKMATDAQVKSAGISARASMYGSDRSLEAAQAHAAASRYGSDKQFQLGTMGLEMDMEKFNKDLGFREWSTEKEFGFREKELQYQDKWNKAQESLQKKQMWLSFAGGLLSDPALKENVVPIDSPLEKVKALQGVKWDWLGGAADAGVLASDVQRVMPEAVMEVEGYRVVNYAAVIGVLVEAVNQMIERHDNGAA